MQKAFPDIEIVKFPGFEPEYAKGNSMVLPAMRLAPKIIASLWRDHKSVERIVAERSIDAVISDNRFGAWSRRVPSVFVTHQANIRTPRFWRWTSAFIGAANRFCRSRYDECWIPDFPQEPYLSGELAHPLPKHRKVREIGILSRFSGCDVPEDHERDIDFLVILSGPEPQRTILEKMVVGQAKGLDASVVILRAMPNSSDYIYNLPSNVTALNHVDDSLFVKLVMNSKTIICRGGYSSLMDLVALNKNAYLVPTPGQTEQEYLFGHLSEKGLFAGCRQSEFKLGAAVAPEVDMSQVFNFSEQVLEACLRDWLDTL